MKLPILGFCTALAIAAAVPAAAQSQTTKLDEALTQSLKDGCATRKVIIRTKSGYRAGMALSLHLRGNRISSEHPSIDAVSAEVRCDDIATMNEFTSVLSISTDAIVRADGAADAKNGTRTSVSTPAQTAELAALTESKKAGSEAKSFFETLGVSLARGDSFTEPYSSATVSNPDVMFGDPRAKTSGMEMTQWSGVGGATPSKSVTTIGVAIIDSGLYATADFEDRITAFYDFTGGGVRKTAPSDAYGHGTHVAGLIGSTFVGVAPNVRLIGLKVLDGKGQGHTSDVLRAIQFAIDNKDALGIRVLNLSLGHPVYEPAATDPLVQAVESAVRAGLIVVTSAGNFGVNPATRLPGYAGVTSPGNAPSALTIGSIQTFDTVSRTDDRIAPYSSRGPSWYDGFAKPDVAAPGHSLLSIAAPGSLLRKQNEARNGPGRYMRLSGTSMAAGVASGLVALVLQVNPGLTPNALKAVLEFSSIPVSDGRGSFDPLAQGAGGLNGAGALALAKAIDPSKRLGAKWLRTGLPYYTVIAGRTLPWSQLMIWGRPPRLRPRRHRREPPGLGHQHRVGHQHRLGHQRRVGQRLRRRGQHRLGHQYRVGHQHRLGHVPGRGRQHRLGHQHCLGQQVPRRGRRRQHRLGHGQRQREQHRVGQPGGDGQHRLGHADRREQPGLGSVGRRGRQHRVGHDAPRAADATGPRQRAPGIEVLVHQHPLAPSATRPCPCRLLRPRRRATGASRFRS